MNRIAVLREFLLGSLLRHQTPVVSCAISPYLVENQGREKQAVDNRI